MNADTRAVEAQATESKSKQEVACCGTEKLEVCCAPEEKTLCCGADAKAPKTCGCN